MGIQVELVPVHTVLWHVQSPLQLFLHHIPFHMHNACNPTKLPWMLAAGGPVPRNISSPFVEASPNTHQLLLKMLEDPDRAAAYISMNCTDAFVDGETSRLFYGPYVHVGESEKFKAHPSLRQVQCVRNAEPYDLDHLERCVPALQLYTVIFCN